MTNDKSTGSAFGHGVENTAPTAASELRRRMASSAAGFLGSAAWVPWKSADDPDGGSIAHVMIRDRPFVPVFTDPAELAAGLPDAEARPVRMAELVTAVPDEFGIVIDPTSSEAANFLHPDALAAIRAELGGGAALDDEADEG